MISRTTGQRPDRSRPARAARPEPHQVLLRRGSRDRGPRSTSSSTRTTKRACAGRRSTSPTIRSTERTWSCDAGSGAGEENRTRIASLEGWSSAIELHPRAGGPASGRGDLNPRPPAPKAGALTKLRYSPFILALTCGSSVPGRFGSQAQRSKTSCHDETSCDPVIRSLKVRRQERAGLGARGCVRRREDGRRAASLPRMLARSGRSPLRFLASRRPGGRSVGRRRNRRGRSRRGTRAS